MQAVLKTLALAAVAAVVSGCTSYSATESSFGDSVHNVIAKQQVGAGGPLAEDEPLDGTDGRRTENVIRVHQSNVGNPASVVGAKEVSGGGQQ